MVEVKVYVEGGGEADRILRTCREGFTKFFRNAGLDGIMPRVVACGSRGQAMDRFRSAVQLDDRDSISVLLVDSEDAVRGICSGATAIPHLDARDGKNLQPVASNEKCHLMTQVMETWFLSDHNTLASYFGQGFNANGLFNNQLESRAKRDVYLVLRSATQHSRKGPYGKAAHSFELLGSINAMAVQAQCAWAERLFVTLGELKRGQAPSMP